MQLRQIANNSVRYSQHSERHESEEAERNKEFEGFKLIQRSVLIRRVIKTERGKNCK